MRYSKLGGQAVIEGVMMKHEKEYSVAVRKPDGGIEVTKKATSSIRDKYKIASLPIIRGMVIFAESLSTGMKTLNYSASFFEEEEKEALGRGLYTLNKRILPYLQKKEEVHK